MSPRRPDRDPTEMLPFGSEPEASPSEDPAPALPRSEDRPEATRPSARVEFPEGEAPRRKFLGWDAPALPAAARWLHEHRGADMDGLLVALPGGRAVRRLQELLARSAPAGWRPPRIVTQGRLVDELLELRDPAAGRLARTLAWRRALAELSAPELERISRGATHRRDAESRLRLAETVRTLHGELAPEGLDFDDLRKKAEELGHHGERDRWRVLAKAQATWRAALSACELSDPHEGRRAALEAGRVKTDVEVVLVGVADMNELLAGALARIGARATALVVAPEEHQDGFDALGRLVPAYWNAIDVPLDDGDDRWFVEEKPADQADRAVDLIAGWAERFGPEQITVGIADDEVAPYLMRRLRESEVDGDGSAESTGARLRLAAGTPLPHTRPFKLLRAVCDLLERGGYTELAALARHPDMAGVIGGDDDAADVLDRYHEEHLPRVVAARWPGSPEKTRGVTALKQRLDEALGPLASGATATLAEWADATRGFLLRVYQAQLDPEVERERVLAGALRTIGTALEELEAVPAALTGDGDGRAAVHEALRLLLRALRAATVPPSPARPGEPTLEGLGWLELALDDAPAMVVTGFNEGRVPQTIQGHAFLPDALRTALGIPDDAARLARDVYATRALLAQRDACALVTGRRTRTGDPLVPSRIAFQTAADKPDAILERVRRFLPPDVTPEPARADHEHPRMPLARAAVTPTVERMSVTSFRSFLRSPYLFYLERVLKLRSRHDRARELEPMQFGNLGHDVLQRFGESDLKDSKSADAIEEFLVEATRAIAEERFGPDPLPTIALQVEQLTYRFRRTAEQQAWRRAEGWHILAAEWQPEDGHPFDVDGTPITLSGKIDRVDVHDDGRWAILDYKTGEVARTPEANARGKHGWTDLQLPLYRVLAEPLAAQHGLEGAPELGYFQVGKDEEHIRILIAESWTEEDHESALEAAREVVRKVRAGRFFDLKDADPWEDQHILRALVGADLLHELELEEDDA